MADEDTLLKAYYTCFRDTDWGVVVLTDLMDKFYKPTFLTGNRTSESSILLNAGGREVIVYILSKIEEYENRGRG